MVSADGDLISILASKEDGTAGENLRPLEGERVIGVRFVRDDVGGDRRVGGELDA